VGALFAQKVTLSAMASARSADSFPIVWSRTVRQVAALSVRMASTWMRVCARLVQALLLAASSVNLPINALPVSLTTYTLIKVSASAEKRAAISTQTNSLEPASVRLAIT